MSSEGKEGKKPSSRKPSGDRDYHIITVRKGRPVDSDNDSE